MSDDDMKTEAEALAAIVTPPTLADLTPYHRVYLVPPGWTELQTERKDFRQEAFHAGDPESFVKMTAEWASERSRLMYNPENEKLVVVVDYRNGTHDEPGRGAHTIHLTMPRSRDWAAWEKLDRQSIRKEALLEHLLEHGHTVVSPQAAEMYELVRDLKATKTVRFKDVRDVSSGSFELQWSDETKATAGTFKVPKFIVVRCSPWEDGESVDIQFEFRYELNEGGLTLKLVALPHRMSELKKRAFRAVATGLADNLGMFPFHSHYLM